MAYVLSYINTLEYFFNLDKSKRCVVECWSWRCHLVAKRMWSGESTWRNRHLILKLAFESKMSWCHNWYIFLISLEENHELDGETELGELLPFWQSTHWQLYVGQEKEKQKRSCEGPNWDRLRSPVCFCACVCVCVCARDLATLYCLGTDKPVLVGPGVAIERMPGERESFLAKTTVGTPVNAFAFV